MAWTLSLLPGQAPDLTHCPQWFQTLSVAMTVPKLILLFLMGFALRNRFRIR